MSTQKKFYQTMPTEQHGAGRKQYIPPQLKKIGSVTDLTQGNGFNDPKTDGAWPSWWQWGS